MDKKSIFIDKSVKCAKIESILCKCFAQENEKEKRTREGMNVS